LSFLGYIRNKRWLTLILYLKVIILICGMKISLFINVVREYIGNNLIKGEEHGIKQF
jgi:hypothetical protein